MKACTLNSKHKWQFERNIVTKRIVLFGRGTHIDVAVRGRYCCACGEVSIRQARRDAPGASLTDYERPSTAKSEKPDA